MTLPTSYTIPSHLLTVDSHPFASGGFGEVYRGTLNDSLVCVKRFRAATEEDLVVATKVRSQHFHSPYAYSRMNQKVICRDAVVWKTLRHPNVLPLLGATISPPQLVSTLMPAGDLSKYIPKNPNANRICLVGVDPLAHSVIARFLPASSYPRSQRDSATSTAAM